MNNIQKELEEISKTISSVFDILNEMEDRVRDLAYIMKRNNQKFKRGDIVKVGADNFCAAGVGIVLYSYADEYGGDDTESYSLYLKCSNHTGYIAWYDEKLLTMIRANKKENITVSDSKCEELLKEF